MNEPTKDPKALLESILKNLGFEFSIEEKDRDGSKVLDIQAPDDSGRLIGRKGQTLFDLQYIINRILFQMDENAEKVMIDVAGYRFSEQDKLVEKALKSADQVRRWGLPGPALRAELLRLPLRVPVLGGPGRVPR